MRASQHLYELGRLALVAALATSAACGPAESLSFCEPGASRACSCESGAAGTQACNSEGEAWGRCLCGAVDGGLADTTPAADTGANDAGVVDGAETMDAALPDTSPTFDATLPTEPTLRQLGLPARCRGPIPLRLEVHTPSAVELSFTYDSGAGESTPTLFAAASDQPTPAPVGDVIQATLVWDSYSDIPADASVTLRVFYDAGGGEVALGEPITLEVRNDPDGDRVVLAAHPSGMMDGGGSSNINNQLSVLRIDPSGLGSDTRANLTVGTGPDMVAIAASASLAVTRNGGEGTLSLIDVVDGSPMVRAAPLSLAPDWIYAFALAPDARSLFVLAGSSGLTSLIDFELIDGVPVERRSTDFDSVAQCLGVSARGDYIAVSRNDPDGDRILELVSRSDMAVVGSLPYASTLCASVRYSHDDRFVATTGGIMGGDVVLFDVSTPSAPRVADQELVGAPFEALFHPQGGAMLVSDLESDRVVPYTISPEGLLTAGAEVSGGLPLAAEMDMLLRGTRAGLCAVAALSSVVLVQLDADGSATLRRTIDTGSSYEDTVQGVAISP
jgi:hypothetical protein